MKEDISYLEKYKILLKPTIATKDICAIEHCGIGKAIDMRREVEGFLLKKGYNLLSGKRVNTWAYMQLYGLSYAEFERIPEVHNWMIENNLEPIDL